MRAERRAPLVAILIVLVGASGVSGQAGGGSQVSRAEQAALRDVVNNVAAGQLAGGDAWLKWSGHFLRADNDRVLVPFTVTLDEVDAGFDSMAMYVRVAPRGDKGPDGQAKVTGSQMATPVSAPESQFSRGNPTAGEASARLGLMAAELSAVRLPFEGFFTARRPEDVDPPVVRRSLVVAPGDYDLYVAVRERPGTGAQAEPKWAVLRRALTVPDLGGRALTASSIILSKRIEPLARPLSPRQRMERPYAFSSAEVFPVTQPTFAADDVLNIVFFVYNLAVDDANLPDVTVACRFLRIGQFGKLFGEMAPQRFGRGHIPPPFDARAGRQLAVTQALPLASFPADSYELEIAVTDHLSGLTITRRVPFVVEG